MIISPADLGWYSNRLIGAGFIVSCPTVGPYVLLLGGPGYFYQPNVSFLFWFAVYTYNPITSSIICSIPEE